MAQKPRLTAYPKELKTLGDHLKKKRLNLQMTQEELAERLGTTACTVRNWKKNKANPSLAFIPKIVEFLGYVPYETSNANLGKQIAIKRRLMGFRQKDLAKLLGVDPSTIKRWENNQSCPQKVLMQRISALLSSIDLRDERILLHKQSV